MKFMRSLEKLKKKIANNTTLIILVIVGVIVAVVVYKYDKELLEKLGIVSIVSVAFVYLIKKIAEQFFARDLEKFKSDLEKEAIQFKIRYEKLHSERAEVIKEVYKKIVRTNRSFHSLMNPMQWAGEPTEEEKGKKAASEINSLVDFYEENRIFFEEKLAGEIDELLKKFRDPWIQFDYSKYKTESKHKDVEEWNKAWKQISEDIPVIKKLIEKRFRDIIGIEKNNYDQNQNPTT